MNRLKGSCLQDRISCVTMVCVCVKQGFSHPRLDNFYWRHTYKLNSADLLSRGTDAQHILISNLWWHVPDFPLDPNLNLDDFSNFILLTCDLSLPEERKTTIVAAHVSCIQDSQLAGFWQNLFTRFSTFSRLQRVVAYCLRLSNCRGIGSTRKCHNQTSASYSFL